MRCTNIILVNAIISRDEPIITVGLNKAFNYEIAPPAKRSRFERQPLLVKYLSIKACVLSSNFKVERANKRFHILFYLCNVQIVIITEIKHIN
jgi:hypothetical protein